MLISKQKFFRILFVLLILIVAISCSILPEIGGTGGEVINTLQSFGTIAEKLGLGSTAVAFMTNEGNSLILTAQVIVTEHKDEWLSTIGAFTTEEGSQIINTAEAYATNEDIKATAAAVVTQVRGYIVGKPPDDIPIMGAQAENIIQSSNIVSYSIKAEIALVAEYYNNQMPANGWEAIIQSSSQSDLSAVLNFKKNSRNASVLLNRNPTGGTIVTIVLSKP